MIGKMLFHGLVAAIVIGSGAAVYAQVKDTAPAPAPAAVAAPQDTAATKEAKTDDGYIRPATDKAGHGMSPHGRERGERGEHGEEDDDD